MRRIWLVVFEIQVHEKRAQKVYRLVSAATRTGQARSDLVLPEGVAFSALSDIEIDGAEDQWDGANRRKARFAEDVHKTFTGRKRGNRRGQVLIGVRVPRDEPADSREHG